MAVASPGHTRIAFRWKQNSAFPGDAQGRYFSCQPLLLYCCPTCWAAPGCASCSWVQDGAQSILQCLSPAALPSPALLGTASRGLPLVPPPASTTPSRASPSLAAVPDSWQGARRALRLQKPARYFQNRAALCSPRTRRQPEQHGAGGAGSTAVSSRCGSEERTPPTAPGRRRRQGKGKGRAGPRIPRSGASRLLQPSGTPLPPPPPPAQSRASRSLPSASSGKPARAPQRRGAVVRGGRGQAGGGCRGLFIC